MLTAEIGGSKCFFFFFLRFVIYTINTPFLFPPLHIHRFIQIDRTNSHTLPSIFENIDRRVSSKMYKLAYAPIEDSDKPAHPFSLIRVIDERSMGTRRQGSTVSSGEM